MINELISAALATALGKALAIAADAKVNDPKNVDGWQAMIEHIQKCINLLTKIQGGKL